MWVGEGKSEIMEGQDMGLSIKRCPEKCGELKMKKRPLTVNIDGVSNHFALKKTP